LICNYKHDKLNERYIGKLTSRKLCFEEEYSRYRKTEWNSRERREEIKKERKSAEKRREKTNRREEKERDALIYESFGRKPG